MQMPDSLPKLVKRCEEVPSSTLALGIPNKLVQRLWGRLVLRQSRTALIVFGILRLTRDRGTGKPCNGLERAVPSPANLAELAR